MQLVVKRGNIDKRIHKVLHEINEVNGSCVFLRMFTIIQYFFNKYVCIGIHLHRYIFAYQ